MLECPTMARLKIDLQNADSPKRRMYLLATISNHKHDCEICSGRYQIAGAQQVRDQAFAGTWGKK